MSVAPNGSNPLLPLPRMASADNTCPTPPKIADTFDGPAPQADKDPGPDQGSDQTGNRSGVEPLTFDEEVGGANGRDRDQGDEQPTDVDRKLFEPKGEKGVWYYEGDRAKDDASRPVASLEPTEAGPEEGDEEKHNQGDTEAHGHHDERRHATGEDSTGEDRRRAPPEDRCHERGPGIHEGGTVQPGIPGQK